MSIRRSLLHQASTITAAFCIQARKHLKSICTSSTFFLILEKFAIDKWFEKGWALLVDKFRIHLYNFIILGRKKDSKGEAVLVPAEIYLMWYCMKLSIAPCLRKNKNLIITYSA